MLNKIVMKKGDPNRLSGLVTMYARLDEAALRDAKREGAPFVEMAQDGLLAMTGDFRHQRSLRDFLSDFAGIDGLEQLKEKLAAESDLPEGTDFREVFRQLDDSNQLAEIPVPSQIVKFRSEQDLLDSEGDIFFLGNYGSLHNAQLALSSFPILYQGLYREAEQQKVRDEIDSLLREIEQKL